MTSIKTMLLLAFVAVMGLSACGSGPRQVRGELPLVTLDSLQRQGERVTLGLGLRNINDQAMTLSEVELRLSLDGELLLTVVHAPDFSIGPRGRDVISLSAEGQSGGLAKLDQLGLAAMERIHWQMELRLADERGRSRQTDSAGFLHPVPGQPDRFR